MTRLPSLLIRRTDFDNLQHLLDTSGAARDAAVLEHLEQELARAEVVEQVPPGVVTMNSTVLFEDAETGARREVRLCYPHEARREPGCVSVLAPVGSALLGVREGESIDWQVPGGLRRLRVVQVVQHSQPEPQAQPAA